jgi:glycosyltransferase involved in cell wall biosynthesis
MSTDTISVVHVVASLHPRGGGPCRTVVQLTDSLARQQVEVSLFTQGLTGEPAVLSSVPAVHRKLAESASSLELKLGLPLLRELKQGDWLRAAMLLHSHGLWLPVNHWAARAARRFHLPLVIHPRGMLEPWALNQKAWKKRAALALFQHQDIKTARVLVATSTIEYENIRKLGFRNPVAVIPNGVHLAVPVAGAMFECEERRVERTVLFLSRIHKKKGLLNLIRAWTVLKPVGWRLRIAGPDEGGHLAAVMALARELGITSSLEYVGEVDGAEKSALYRRTDVFVLPTFSENFGVVVAEALAHGIPVITTRGAPWADLETHRCGWWIDIGVEPLVQALREAMALNDDERRAMGERGREYVRRYDWGDIARQTIEVYRWVLGQGHQPDCVQVD